MIIIGIMGAPINNDNLGCLALTYSLIDMLNQIEKEWSDSFKYIVFEENSNPFVIPEFINQIQIPGLLLETVQVGNFRDILRRIKNQRKNKLFLDKLNTCDVVIDLTQGDSFADIYGDKRFNAQSSLKTVVLKKNKPLILGSQTIGPFIKQRNKNKAIQIIRKAYATIARDEVSASFVNAFVRDHCYTSGDLAFRLPFTKIDRVFVSKPVNIGLNVSGLLTANSSEPTLKKFSLRANYDELIHKIIQYLISQKYIIHLIGHVRADFEINSKLSIEYPSLVLAPIFTNPIQAKEYISKMDLFIGSRMHATIAAVSSSTPVIPIGYSRKFYGLFSSIEYNTIVDLSEMETNECFNSIKKNINDYSILIEETNKAHQRIISIIKETMELYSKLINDCVN